MASLMRAEAAPATELLELASLPSSSPVNVPATLAERERERCVARRAARLARLPREARLPASETSSSARWISSLASALGSAGAGALALVGIGEGSCSMGRRCSPRQDEVN